MKLIIAEKPSVGMDFAKALGIKEKKDGYVVAGDYYITWAVGHLLKIDDSIAPSQWSLETLPILPESFRYTTSKETQKQFSVIKNLIKQAKEVIISTDAGREGELIARLILIQSGWKNWENTYRFWTSEALTKEVILKTLKSMKKAKEYDSLYYSALARQHADWLVGINLTRAVTLRAKGDGKSVWSVGRVQTPVLKLIVERDYQIESFKPQEYFILKCTFSNRNVEYDGYLKRDISEVEVRESEDEEREEREEGQRLSKEEAFRILKDIENEKNALVVKVQEKEVKESPPLLHSLTSLQREANKLYGFSAEETLTIAQDLYESKLISYPRTDAQHLSESSKELVKSILKKLKREDLIEKVDKVGKRVFNDSKLTDHYAIIPMEMWRGDEKDLNDKHKKIYELVYRKFIGAFMDDYVYSSVVVITKVKDYMFYSSFKADKVLGWRELYNSEKKQNTIQIKEKDVVSIKDKKAQQRFTKPPARYTEATLLKEMEKLGLGTPATRSTIIETLKKREYIKTERKSLISTGKGRELLDKMKTSMITDIELTAKWEKELNDIYIARKSYSGYKEFIEEIKLLVLDEIAKLKTVEFVAKKEVVGRCECGGDVVENAKNFKCLKCGKVVWKEAYGKKLSRTSALSLMQGKKVEVKGLKSKNGKSFDAYLFYKDGKVRLEFKG